MEDRRKIIRFNFAGATGWDLVASWFLSEYRFACRIVRKLTRPGGIYAGFDLTTARLVVQMPLGSYELVEGPRVVPCAGVAFGGGL